MKEAREGVPGPLESDPAAVPTPPESGAETLAGEAAVGHVADVVADALQTVAGNGQREEVLRAVNDELEESGLRVVDVAKRPNERRGVHTGLTREELLAALATKRQVREIREARSAQILGRRVIKNATSRRRRA